MFRRLLTLLVALPLLLPQGVCVCDFLRKCEACTECDANVELEAPACGCQHERTAEVENDSDKTCTCYQSGSPESPEHRTLPCPPKSSAQWKADTATPPQPVCVPFVGLMTDPEALVTTSTCLSPSFQASTANQPLFLTLLTLRI